MNDDMEYVFSSVQVSKGDFFPIWSPSIDSLRSMMILPISFFFFLLGPSELSASLWPLLASLLTIILTFYIGRVLFDSKAGLVAAFLMAIFTLDIVFATQLVPSVPGMLFMTASMLLFLIAEKEKKKNKSKIYFVLSGVFIGLAYLAAELFFIMGFFFLSYFLWKRKFRKEYFLILAGFLIIFSIEAGFMYEKTGNPLHRLNVIHEAELTVETNTDPNYYPRVIFDFIDPSYSAHEGNLGIFVYLFIIASLFAAYKREWRIVFLSIFILIAMTYLQFGVMTSTFKPIAKWVRYLVIFSPAICLSIAYLFVKTTKTRSLLISILIISFIATLPYTVGAAGIYNSWVSDFREAYNYLKTLPERPIFTDSGSHGYITLYFEFKRPIDILEYSTLDQLKDSYVIIDGSSGVVSYPPMRNLLPEYARNPPSDWILLRVITGGQDFYDPKIYYVP